jgi:hypothetical protein
MLLFILHPSPGCIQPWKGAQLSGIGPNCPQKVSFYVRCRCLASPLAFPGVPGAPPWFVAPVPVPCCRPDGLLAQCSQPSARAQENPMYLCFRTSSDISGRQRHNQALITVTCAFFCLWAVLFLPLPLPWTLSQGQ